MRIDDKLIRRVKLRELRILLAAAQCGSLVKAAEKLGLTQPAVSKAILELEDTFRTRLLDRTHSGVGPTAQGKILLRRVLNIFDELKLAGEELDYFADPTVGTFGVGCGHAVSAGLLPRILEVLSKDHPRVCCRVLEADRDQIFAALRKREVDVLLARPLVEEADDLQFEKLYDEKLFVIVGANHSLASRPRISPDELAAQRWVLPMEDATVGRLVEAVLMKHGIPIPRVSVISASIQVTCSLLSSGNFVSMLPGSVLAFHLIRDSFRVLPFQKSETSGPVGIITVKQRDVAPTARLFMEYARKIAAPLEAFDVREHSKARRAQNIRR